MNNKNLQYCSYKISKSLKKVEKIGLASFKQT